MSGGRRLWLLFKEERVSECTFFVLGGARGGTSKDGDISIHAVIWLSWSTR